MYAWQAEIALGKHGSKGANCGMKSWIDECEAALSHAKGGSLCEESNLVEAAGVGLLHGTDSK
jgi:hypothetical protein